MNSDGPDIIQTLDTSLAPIQSREERRLALHEAICRCPKCQGTIQKNKLCRSCAQLDRMIDDLGAVS